MVYIKKNYLLNQRIYNKKMLNFKVNFLQYNKRIINQKLNYHKWSNLPNKWKIMLEKLVKFYILNQMLNIKELNKKTLDY